MKVVLDANVLVAAFFSEGVCSKLLVRARKGEIVTPRNFEALFAD